MEKEGKREIWAIFGNFYAIFGKFGQVRTSQDKSGQGNKL